MQRQVRNRIQSHVPLLTGVLTIISLTLVFSAVLGALPRDVLPRHEFILDLIPHLNVVLSGAAICTILVGVRAIRAGNIDRHRTAMLASAALFGLFLVLYLYRVTLEGPSEFSGPAELRQFLYLPVLAIHILLAVICIPFVYYALLLGWSYPVTVLPDTSHKTVGRIAAVLWLVSFSLGIVVYLLLHAF